MKIYTRTGDAGTTALFGGDRVPKHHPRIEAYGTVDEANSCIGLALSYLGDDPAQQPLADVLRRVQHELFVLGADLATPLDARASVPRIDDVHFQRLEADIDRFEADLPPLKQFILPGGTAAASALHLARTVCRRAERLAVKVADGETLSKHTLVYLNRLSDLLFVVARWANQRADAAETVWSIDGT